MKRLLSFAFLVPASAAFADTVYLKNGEWIDGMISLKTNTFVELQIGDIGKIELDIADIHSIERNSRTGGKSVDETYVEPKGRTEVVGAKGKDESGKNKAAGKDGDKAPAKKETDQKDSAKKGPEKKNSGKNDSDQIDAGKKEPVKEGGDEQDTDQSDSKDTTTVKSGEKKGEETKVTSEEEAALDAKKASIDPELKKRIEELVDEVQRERARNRVQAERHLEAIGPPAIPFLVPIARSPNDLTRVAVMRLFHSFGDQQVIGVTIDSLLDENEYVRDYANQTLKRITGEDFKYLPSASPRRREAAQKKWAEWWAAEKKTMAEERKKAEEAQ